jgi:hypothetical protein
MPSRHFLHVPGGIGALGAEYGTVHGKAFRLSQLPNLKERMDTCDIAGAEIAKPDTRIGKRPCSAADAVEKHRARPPPLLSPSRRTDRRTILRSPTQADNMIRKGDAP